MPLLFFLLAASPFSRADEYPSRWLLPEQGRDCRQLGVQHRGPRHDCSGTTKLAEYWSCGGAGAFLILGARKSDVLNACSPSAVKLCAAQIPEAGVPAEAAPAENPWPEHPCVEALIRCNLKLHDADAETLSGCARAEYRGKKCPACRRAPGGAAPAGSWRVSSLGLAAPEPSRVYRHPERFEGDEIEPGAECAIFFAIGVECGDGRRRVWSTVNPAQQSCILSCQAGEGTP